VGRRLYISDLHLSDERPEANERFFSFMEAEAATAEELYVLGDLFEYWVGDDDLDDPFNAVIAGFFGKRFAEETGAGLLGDPALVGDTLLMHGDTLCTDDQDYQSWRRTARSADWQREFLGKPLAERRRVVRGLREKSKEVIQAKPADIMDVNDGAVREALRRHRATRLIHGHTHRPGHHVLDVDGRRCERWVLPDWYGAGGYLEIRDGAARLVRW
jgi:UDP-2,3-diacylglucosamine hydrolase